MAARKRKEPIHRIFYICSTYTPDEAWSEFLKDCSFGKFPKGVKFEDGAIKCTRKKQSFVQYIPSDTEKALEVILNVFRDKLGIKTTKEKKSASIKLDKCREESRIKDWKQASTIALKNALLKHFAEKYVRENYMDEDEHRKLLIILNVGISTKLIQPGDINMINGQIVNIQGLNFNPYNREISLKGYLKTPQQMPYPIPLDYTPVKQENYEKLYFDVLDYHGTKSAKLGLKGTSTTQLPTTSEIDDEY